MLTGQHLAVPALDTSYFGGKEKGAAHHNFLLLFAQDRKVSCGDLEALVVAGSKRPSPERKLSGLPAALSFASRPA